MEGGQDFAAPETEQQQQQQPYTSQQYGEAASSHDNEGDHSGGLKRSAEGDYNANKKRFKHDSNDNRTIRILLQSKDAGGIIGKAGSNIKRLRSEYNAVVTVPDTNFTERVLTITAPMQTALTILSECVPKIGEHSRGSNNPSHDIQLLIQRSQIGSIIGRAGYKIKEIRESSGANIKVFSDCLPNSTERVVAMSGPLETIVKCVEIIYQTLENTPIKGQVGLYDPGMQGGYDGWDGPGGGYYDDGRGPMGHRGGGRMGGRQGGGGRMRGGGGGGGRRRGGGGGGYNDSGGPGIFGGGGNDFSQDISGGTFNDGGFGGGGMGGPNQGQQGDQTVTSTQVTIPKDLAGSIIGKKGIRIKEIRQSCGAVIKIDDPLPGADDRIITITGSQNEINHAQFLLQQSVRKYSGKKF